jgi:hypothetical protein
MAQYTIKKVFNFINAKDILSLFLLFIVFPFAIVSKIFIRGFWLVTEDENEARDNGYWFFKWVRENRKKQKIADNAPVSRQLKTTTSMIVNNFFGCYNSYIARNQRKAH